MPPRRRWTRWRALVERVGHLHAEIERLVALARGDAEPDLAVVRASWQMFISPAIWSWRPFAGLWRWDALPLPLRYAIHAALAIAAGQTISLALPWGTHYWIRSESLAAAAPGPGSRHRAALAR